MATTPTVSVSSKCYIPQTEGVDAEVSDEKKEEKQVDATIISLVALSQ